MTLKKLAALRFEVRRRTFRDWRNPQSAIRNPQSGYVLIFTIGALTVMLILITGILPSVAQELKRERETEMLFRGREIVDAIARYRRLAAQMGSPVGGPGLQGQVGGQVLQGQIGVGFPWPRSLEQLVEGVTLRGSTRRVRLLRPSALKDPMNHHRPWRPVGFNDPALREFLEAFFDSRGQPLSVWPPQFRMQYLGTTIDLGHDQQEKRDRQDRTRTPSAFGGIFSQDDQSKQKSYIFGVVSESKEKPLRDYYGLERYNQWVFAYIPELQSVPAMGDEQIQELSREIIFPTDPLALNQFGGMMGGISVSPVVRPPNVNLGNQPGGRGKLPTPPGGGGSNPPSPRR